MPQRVLLLYGSGGGGHKASANALQLLLSSIPAIIVDTIDAAALAGAGPGDRLYNVLLSYNALSLIDVLHNAVQAFFPLVLPSLRAKFRAQWPRHPDLTTVVSFIPILNSVFAETLPSHVKLFTVLTDFSHTNVHPWIQHVRQHLVTGTDVAYSQALVNGYLPPDSPSASMCVTRTSGMVVAPRFYTLATLEHRLGTAAAMDFDPTLQTFLLLFGGAPPTDLMTSLVHHLTHRDKKHAVNIIAVCGRNKLLHDRLTRRKRPNQTLFITAFTNQVPLYMQMSDVLIGKPGPGVVSEAFVSGLPCVLVCQEGGVMKQELDVLDWVRRERVGMVVSEAAEAAAISSEQIAQMRATIAAAPRNNAVFEVRDLILDSLGVPAPKSPSAKLSHASTSEGPEECDIADAHLPSASSVKIRAGSYPRPLRSESLSPTTVSIPPRGLDRQSSLLNGRALDRPTMAHALSVEPSSRYHMRRSVP